MAGGYMSGDSNAYEPSKATVKEKTVEEYFDACIEQARKNVEELCIKKAKLEAMNLHKAPYTTLTGLLQTFPF